MKNYIFLLILSLGLFAQAQTWESLAYNEDQPNIELNPLKGIAANFKSDNDFPHSISNLTITFGEITNDVTGAFEFDKIDEFIEEQALEGRYAIIQVNVDDGKLIDKDQIVIDDNGNQTYIGAQYDLPASLSQVERFYYKGDDTADNQNVPSMVVNYNNPLMMTAMKDFIVALAAKYKDDPRVFMVHYGLYGVFGEWKLGFGKKFVPANYALTSLNKKEITDAYAFNFPNKNLIARFPEFVSQPQSVGYSDGLYFGATYNDINPNQAGVFLTELKKFNADTNWKNHVIGGEIDPFLQKKLWEDNPDGNIFDKIVTGDPDLTVPVDQRVGDVFDRTHPTFLFQNFMLKKEFVGPKGGVHGPGQPDSGDANPYVGQSNAAWWANAIRATKRSGYTLYVKEFSVSAKDGKPSVEVNIKNTGIAPMYANWDVEFAYLDENEEPVSLGTSSTWNLKGIQPYVEDNKRLFISDALLPDLEGTYTFVLRIVNPLNEGITLADNIFRTYPNAKPVRFANVTQDLHKEGWLTLGSATISGGNLGAIPVAVTGISTSGASEFTLDLDSQKVLQLLASAQPDTASNPSIVWVSDSPSTASVDANGFVTTYAVSGEVNIRAYTEDGSFTAEFVINVSPFWILPKKIEAEDFSGVFNNLSPGEDEFSAIKAQIIPATATEAERSILTDIGDGDWVEYSIKVTEAADYEIDFRAVGFSGPGDAKMEILRENDVLIEEVSFGEGIENGTYGISTSGIFRLEAGNQKIKLRVTRSNFDLDWIEFKKIEAEYTLIPSRIEAESFSDLISEGATEVDLPLGEDGGQALGFLGDGDLISYAVTVSEAADFVLDFRAVSFSGPGDAKMEILRENGELIEEVSFGEGIDNGTYGTFTSGVFALAAGNQIIKLKVTRSNFDINWIQFKRTSAVYVTIPNRIEAERFSDLTSGGITEVDLPVGEDGGKALGFLGDGDVISYAVTVSEGADFILDFRTVGFSGPGDAKMEILRENDELIEEISFGEGVDNGMYGTFSSGMFALAAGNHIIKLKVTRSNFDINWIQFRFDEDINVEPLITDGTYSIQSKNLAYMAASRSDGPVKSRLSEKGNRTKWVFTHLGDDVYTINSAKFSGDRIAVASGVCGNRSRLVLTSLEGNINTAKWKVTVVDGYFMFSPVNCEGLSIDIFKNRPNRAHLFMTRTMNSNQLFTLIETTIDTSPLIADGLYTMQSKNLAYIDVTRSGGNAKSRLSENGNGTKWKFTHMGEDVYIINSAKFPTQHLAIASETCGNRNRLVLKTVEEEEDTTKWKATEVDGYFMFSPVNCSGLSMDIFKNNPNKVHLFTTRLTNNNNQLFKLVNEEVVADIVFNGDVLFGESAVTVHPNPVATTLNIDIAKANGSVTKIYVYNFYGTLLYSVETTKTSAQINVADLRANGMVIVHITNSAQTYTYQVILE